MSERMTVSGYLRVSTDRQAEEGHGLDVQRETIEGWAAMNDKSIGAFYADEGISGSDGLEKRVGLAAAINSVAERRAAGIVVYRLDRLARNLILQEQLLSEIWRHDGVVFSTSSAESEYLQHGDDPTQPERKLIRQILGATAEYERSLITLRMMAGRQRKKAMGGFAGGAPPYGYATDHKGNLVKNPEQQQVIKRMVGWRRQGLTFPQIAARLNAELVPSARGLEWFSETVRRAILHYEKATGTKVVRGDIADRYKGGPGALTA